MKIINFGDTNSVINQYMAELRDVNIQLDRAKFRHNLVRIGSLMAYEISKTLHYADHQVQTPLGTATASTPDENLVLGTIFRAGLPYHQGFLDVFDQADNAFVSAYRYYKDKECKDVGVKVEYMGAPCLKDKTLIIADPMLATGGSMELSYQAFCTKGVPSTVHFACVIAAQQGVEYLKEHFGKQDNFTLWCAAIDPSLNEHAYIVPGLGDAGDLSFGTKES
jgi:uracil phosphoribosyltransferase